ncbi:MAG: hypothetical protein P4L53_02310 [Candidatus Obscuribacterales bacterium]|nr:hypothetical protein [Candidatus Obscuribacterales bacterium]
MGNAFDAPPPSGSDKGQPRNEGDKGSEKALFNQVHGKGAEAVKPESALDKQIAQLQREISEGFKAAETAIANAAGHLKTLADQNFDPSHPYHPDNVMKAATLDHPPGSQADVTQKNLHAAVKGEIPASKVLSA